MLTYLLGPILSLLPQRWRKELFGGVGIDWTRATMISGVVIGGACVFGLIAWYLIAVQQGVDEQLEAALRGAQRIPDRQTGMAMGFASLVAFALDPLTWMLAYFSVEGWFRAFAAVVNGEAPASGPLVMIDAVARWYKRRAYEKRVPLVADRVSFDAQGKEWNLKVESCRPKPLWKYRKVVKFNEEFFQVAGESAAAGSPARPHVYLLRAAPAGEAYRGMDVYDPSDVLRAVSLSAGQAALHAMRDGFRIQTLGLVADTVERLVNENGVFLRVESCRPKRDWAVGQLVRYEECLYRMAESYDAAPPRPFGFVLQLHTVRAPGRRVIEYSPESVKHGGEQ